MIDFSKAFDLIDHNILAQKLGKLGFDDQATRLITSYLNNRVQFVSCNNKNSKDKTLDPVGCPQGSILGPLMYLIYTIDIKNLLAEHFHIMYADDTGLIVRLKKNEGTEKIRDLMQRILNHFTLNKLKMNVTKTVIMGKGIEGEIAVEGTNMNISKKSGGEKYLGVKINPELNWAGHFEELVRKVKFGLHALSKIKKVNNVQVKKICIRGIYQKPYQLCHSCLVSYTHKAAENNIGATKQGRNPNDSRGKETSPHCKPIQAPRHPKCRGSIYTISNSRGQKTKGKYK